jgi:hypothetical protein
VKPTTHAQIGIDGWAADFAAPSTMASPFVCVPNDSEFCDRGLRAQIDQAIETRGDEAKGRWREVFRRLSEAATIVPLVNRRTLSLVSKRVGNQQYHPWWGALYDQMWVR